MSSHLAFAAFLYLISLSPWAYINWKLYESGRWSAFRIFALWSLIRVACLVPLVWVDFAVYSELAWSCRAVTLALLYASVCELFEVKIWVGVLSGSVLGVAWLTTNFPLESAWRVLELGLAMACAARLLLRWSTSAKRVFREMHSLRQRGLTWEQNQLIAAGLLVYTLFPAISETQSVMEYGGWLRLVPVVSGLLACAIWIRGIQSGVAFPRSSSKLGSFQRFKRHGRVNQRATAGRARDC